jgi:hypothetical protein
MTYGLVSHLSDTNGSQFITSLSEGHWFLFKLNTLFQGHVGSHPGQPGVLRRFGTALLYPRLTPWENQSEWLLVQVRLSIPPHWKTFVYFGAPSHD